MNLTVVKCLQPHPSAVYQNSGGVFSLLLFELLIALLMKIELFQKTNECDSNSIRTYENPDLVTALSISVAYDI